MTKNTNTPPHENNKNWSAMKTAIFAALFSAILTAIGAMYFQSKLLDETTGMAAIQTRISTCIGLAEHHKQYANETSGATAVFVEIGDTSVPMNTSLNRKRHEASINMARALDLCLVGFNRVSDINTCISGDTYDENGALFEYIRVVDPTSENKAEEGQERSGEFSPAC